MVRIAALGFCLFCGPHELNVGDPCSPVRDISSGGSDVTDAGWAPPTHGSKHRAVGALASDSERTQTVSCSIGRCRVLQPTCCLCPWTAASTPRRPTRERRGGGEESLRDLGPVPAPFSGFIGELRSRASRRRASAVRRLSMPCAGLGPADAARRDRGRMRPGSRGGRRSREQPPRPQRAASRAWSSPPNALRE